MVAKAKKSRKSRALVVAYLENVSSSIFDTYRKEITELAGGKHGIYALYRNKRLYYVGLTKNLKGRVNHHLKDRHAGKWNYFSIYLVRSERHLKDLEALAIRISDPRGNRTRGNPVNATNLRRLFQRKLIARAEAEIGELMNGFGGGFPKAKAKHNTRATLSKKKGKRPLEGVFSKATTLYANYRGKLIKARVRRNGVVRLVASGRMFNSPSLAAAAAIGKKTRNGWAFWRYKNAAGEMVKIATLRK